MSISSLIITFYVSAIEESTVEELSSLVGWLAIVHPSVIH